MKCRILLLLTLILAICATCALGETALSLQDGVLELPEGVTQSGKVITIEAPGEYRVSGSLTDGQLAVDSTRDGKVTLYLDNVTIHNSDGPAIDIRSASPRAIISLVDHTENRLTSGESYQLETEDEPCGVIFSKADLTLSGNGALWVEAGTLDGIVSKDDLRIKGGEITVTAPRHGIKGKDYVAISDGVLSVRAGKDGIKSTNKKDSARGYVEITGGEIHIVCGDDPISVVTRLTITGGHVSAEVASEETAE